MANTIGPRGFVPSRYRDGTSWDGGFNLYHVPASDINQYNPGDAVKSSPNADANGIPDVVKITNGTHTIRGIVVGILVAAPNNPSLVGANLNLTVQNTPGVGKTQDYWLLVVDDPAVMFELQDDGLTALTATASNKNCSFTVANPTFPQQNSMTTLTTASVATTAALPIKMMGLVQKPNNVFGANANWLVMINQHEFQGGIPGA